MNQVSEKHSFGRLSWLALASCWLALACATRHHPTTNITSVGRIRSRSHLSHAAAAATAAASPSLNSNALGTRDLLNSNVNIRLYLLFDLRLDL